MGGMSSLLVDFLLLVNWDSGWYGFPTFVADHRCVSSPRNMLIHMHLIDDVDP